MTSLEKKALIETIKDITRRGVLLLLVFGWGVFCVALPGKWPLIVFIPLVIGLLISTFNVIFIYHLYNVDNKNATKEGKNE